MHIGLREDLIRRASCEKGVAISEIESWTTIQMHEAFGSLRQQGRVVYVGNRHLRRYFVDPANAKRYEAELAQQAAEKKAAMNVILAAQRREKRAAASALRPAKPRGRPPKPKLAVVEAVKKPRPPRAAKPPKQLAVKPESAKPQKAAPGVTIPRYTGQKWDKDKPADYSRAKLTVYPSHPGYDMRYSLPPGAVVEGEFSRIPLGATLEAAA